MARPLIQHGVTQLQELFERSRGHIDTLRKLEHELGFRQVPKAAALLSEVQSALRVAMRAQAVPAVPEPAVAPPQVTPGVPRRPALWDGLGTGVPPWTAAPTPTAVTPSPRTSPSVVSPALPPARPRLTLSLEDACRLLKVAPGDTWEAIERSRRALVMATHPTKVARLAGGAREQVLAQARQVNSAYLELAARREGSR